jgi:hypothetical protein
VREGLSYALRCSLDGIKCTDVASQAIGDVVYVYLSGRVNMSSNLTSWLSCPGLSAAVCAITLQAYVTNESCHAATGDC